MENELTIVMPEGYMNFEITTSNKLIADTNNNGNWDDIYFSLPLPDGKWSIKNIDVQLNIVTLIKSEEDGNTKRPNQ